MSNENQNEKTSRINREIVFRDVRFRYSVHKATPYGLQMEMSVISPETGKILQSEGRRKKIRKRLEAELRELNTEDDSEAQSEKRKAEIALKLDQIKSGKRLEALNATETARLATIDDSEIEKTAKMLAERIYGHYRDEIICALKLQNGAKLKMRTIYDMYQHSFFSTLPVVKQKVLSQKMSALRAMCDMLDDKCIDCLSDRDISALAARLGGRKNEKIRLLEKFFDYLGAEGILSGENPVSKYRFCTEERKRRSPYGKETSTLSWTCEKKLHDLIAKKLGDDCALAIPLVKGFGMSVERLLEIKWQDITICGDKVIIRDYHPDYTGGTYSYDRPPTRETADFIVRKYQMMLQKYPAGAIAQMNVVPISEKTSKKNKKAALSQYFRTMLLAAGIGNDTIKSAVDSSHPKAAGGAGYSLLRKHYYSILEHVCGVDLQSGVGCYLRGARIFDVTNDYYRSFSDESGQYFLQTIMDRDTRFLDYILEKTQEIDEQKTENGNKKIVVHHGPAGTQTAVQTAEKIIIPAGTIITISSKHGVSGDIDCHYV